MLMFIYEIFRKFKLMFLLNTALLVVVTLFAACSLFTISPVVDFLVHPDLQGISPLTVKAIGVLDFLGMSVTLGNWLIVFIAFIALSSIFQVLATHSILRTTYAVMRNIILGMFKDFFNARWYFFSSAKQGILLNSFNRELTVVSNAFVAVPRFFASALQLIFFLGIPLYISWQVTLISLGIAFLFAVPLILLGKISYRLGVLNTETANKMMAVVYENLNLAKIVLGFGNQHKSFNDLDTAFAAHRNVTIKSQNLERATPVLYRPLGMIMVVIALFVARSFNVPLSETVVLLLSLREVSTSIGGLTAQRNAMRNFTPSYEQVNALRRRAKELEQRSGGKEFRGFKSELLVEGLSFAYPGHQPVLTGMNASIPKGKMVAFVGESGAGKSTFVDMIMGFHEPLNGRIMFDGTPLRDFDINSYRRRIGYVPQDSVLFDMTIRDNFLWACETATDEDIRHACRQANAGEFIEKLPKGYDTIVGNRGVRLSGGQVQRIALARAILRKPDLLILDEATSSLDTYSEKMIQGAIENISKETTIIVIAHRLSTIVNADYVYVLKEGRILEEGVYSDLIRMRGHFNRMVEMQLL